MKKFVSENWYKLMIGSSLLMASFGFMVHSVSPAKAMESNIKSLNTNLTPTPGEAYVTGCGISNGYAYLVDFKINGRNHYYKIPLDRFKTSSDYGE
jgi:hypothetical protein